MYNKLTIVGPEASDENESRPGINRVHIESLLLMAKYDNIFKQKLLEERESALEESGIEFTPVEKMLLMNIGREKLLQTIDEFTVPGINKKSLSNWRTAAAVIMLLSSVLIVGPLSTTACRSEQVKSGEVMVTDGWVDDDTFRWTAAGMPKRGLTDIAERKATAKRVAILNSQYTILEKFKGARIEGAGGMATFYEEDYTRGREIIQTVKKGKVVKETYDKEQNCEVVFEVKSPKLKKKIFEAAFR
ncbi:MAG: hypothetical protein GY754_45455 [bacterium]|nr:hypothetical protein [bacterium]